MPAAQFEAPADTPLLSRPLSREIVAYSRFSASSLCSRPAWTHPGQIVCFILPCRLPHLSRHCHGPIHGKSSSVPRFLEAYSFAFPRVSRARRYSEAVRAPAELCPTWMNGETFCKPISRTIVHASRQSCKGREMILYLYVLKVWNWRTIVIVNSESESRLVDGKTFRLSTASLFAKRPPWHLLMASINTYLLSSL
ncbi:hypothetical protein BDY21DRAFT_18176 [Lineolata rhizophorae]|uniref:Uncharacterized protein n=1 Tax=Lineolata rhizophorae TaxID=578093 RepID=A0A6A6P299_9PEZI|nr:hypothetical protein BDY21DRAFT_18176 [Lineolata rhizophorae]